MTTRKWGIAAFFALATAVFAGPGTITYQGNLANSNGTPVSGTYGMRFWIFIVPTDGTWVWQEIETSVTVQNGIFSATLGDGSAFGPLFANYSDLYLELAVDLNKSGTFQSSEIYSPRLKLAGAAWAMDSDTLDKRHASEFSLTAHNHDAAYWRLAGNAGATSGTHFLGTTDNIPLDLRVNNLRALRLESNGQSPNLIGGYSGNHVAAGVVGATIAGGGKSTRINRIASDYGTIGGGNGNAITNGIATISGGESNSVGGNWSTIGGGFNNEITSYGATIGGGIQSRASGLKSTIAGGEHNWTRGFSAAVGGGRGNQANGHYATIAGGDSNLAGGLTSTICGGWTNIASGTLATVAGGALNSAAGDYSFAAGRQAAANHEGCFVWGDSTGLGTVKSTATNQFLVRAGGGMMVTPLTGPLRPGAQLHVLLDSGMSWPHLFLQETQSSDFARLRLATTVSSATQFWDVAARPGAFNIYYHGDQQNILQLLPDDASNLLWMRNGAHLTNGGAWTNASDANVKANFRPADGRQVLEQVAALPIQTWNYRSEPETTRRMGPTAQDFHAAFGLGDSDKTISTVDADGVALAAIQGLYGMVQEQSAEISALKANADAQALAQQQHIAALQQQNHALETRLATLEAMAKTTEQQQPPAK